MNVKHKIVLITGGAGGLGSAIAEKLCGQGAVTYLLDLDEKKGMEVQVRLQKAGNQAYFIKMDLTDEKSWQETVDCIYQKEQRIDVLINNAGINIRKSIEEMRIEEWNTMMLVNTGSVFLGCKYVVPVMKEQKNGSIINTSSVCGLIGHKYTTEAYTATKGAVTLFTKSIASRYAPYGVRCNSIHPSTVQTPLVEEMMKDPQKAAERIGEVPLGRLATVEDVANAVLYLASEEAAFINGVSLPIDGGVTCY
ncbi:MAG: SDR family oxidoreductase [Lachnospiraceae bacterium]|nr:SDR family oxidoreductase [Lachnospiraceae bacterium]